MGIYKKNLQAIAEVVAGIVVSEKDCPAILGEDSLDRKTQLWSWKAPWYP